MRFSAIVRAACCAVAAEAASSSLPSFMTQAKRAGVKESDRHKQFVDHLQRQHMGRAHKRQATPLPAVAAEAVLRLDMSIYADHSTADETFAGMLSHEIHPEIFAEERFVEGGSAPFVACGSQRGAKAARDALSKVRARLFCFAQSRWP